MLERSGRSAHVEVRAVIAVGPAAPESVRESRGQVTVDGAIDIIAAAEFATDVVGTVVAVDAVGVVAAVARQRAARDIHVRKMVGPLVAQGDRARPCRIGGVGRETSGVVVLLAERMAPDSELLTQDRLDVVVEARIAARVGPADDVRRDQSQEVAVPVTTDDPFEVPSGASQPRPGLAHDHIRVAGPTLGGDRPPGRVERLDVHRDAEHVDGAQICDSGIGQFHGVEPDLGVVRTGEGA